MYRVDRNNFYKHEKTATIFTPDYVSDFLYEILHRHVSKRGIVIDPCVGKGSLLKPWVRNGYNVLAIDIKRQGYPKTIVRNYLEIERGEMDGVKASLVIMNPPFNLDKTTKQYISEHYGGRPLLPEVWFQKGVELFGHETPMVMFTPYGFRLNQSQTSKRWKKFIDKEYPEITSIISLPKDVFEGILFHSEVLVFNLPQLKGHYYLKQYDGEKRAVETK
jgi:type I restriction enzyme M protein